MRRVLTLLTVASLLIAGGCGKSYEERLAKTLERRRYEKLLDKNLMPAPQKNEGKFQELTVFLRPPREMALSKEFLLTVEEGKFDLAASFTDDKGDTLNVLARLKRPKNAPKKKTPTPADTAVRGDFVADVIAVVNPSYTTEVDTTKLKEETKKGNKFKRVPTFEANGKNVQIFFYGGKTERHEVALIFEYPKEEHSAINKKIDLCLESFAVDRRAQRAYAGNEGEEESGEEGAGGGAVPL